MTSTAVRSTGKLRSALGWLLIAVLVIAFALVIGSISISTPQSRGALDPDSAKESGSAALAELLRDQGVEITIARSRAEAVAALDDDATLAMADPYALSDEAVKELVAPAENVVFLSSASRLLRVFDLGENATPPAAEQFTAECSQPELANIGSIRPDRFFTPASGVTGCFADATTEAAAVLVDDHGDGRTVLLEGSALLSNEHLAENGNAALGLALLGQSDRLVWYVPSFQDTDIEAVGDDTLASLTPTWVTPAIMLLLIAGIVIAIDRKSVV